MPRIGAAVAGAHRQPVREAVDAVCRKRHRRLEAAADVQHAHVVSVGERKPCQIVVSATWLPIRDHRLLVTAVALPSVHGGSQRQAGAGNRLVRKSLKRRIFDVAAQVGWHRTRSEHALPQTQRSAPHVDLLEIRRDVADHEFAVTRLHERCAARRRTLHAARRGVVRGGVEHRKRGRIGHVQPTGRKGQRAVLADDIRWRGHLRPEPLVAQVRLHLQPITFSQRLGEEKYLAQPSAALPIAVRRICDLVVREEPFNQPPAIADTGGLALLSARLDVQQLIVAVRLVHRRINGHTVYAEHAGRQGRPSSRRLNE